MVDPKINSLIYQPWLVVMLHQSISSAKPPQKKKLYSGWLLIGFTTLYTLWLFKIAMENSHFSQYTSHRKSCCGKARCSSMWFSRWWRKPPSFGEVPDLHDISCILLLGLAQHITSFVTHDIPWNIPMISRKFLSPVSPVSILDAEKWQILSWWVCRYRLPVIPN